MPSSRLSCNSVTSLSNLNHPPYCHLFPTMTSSPSVSAITVENLVFPASVRPPSTEASFFLGGAGVRGLITQGKFTTFTAIGIYLEEAALPALAHNWKGKSATELAESVAFFRDIVTGPFQKFIHTTMLKPLSGAEYAQKVSENCVAIWKSLGIYSDAEEKAIAKFLQIFKDHNFPPGHSLFYKQCPPTSLKIAFGKHDAIPEAEAAVIENGPLSQSVLESMIGENGVSPAAKESLAARLHQLMNVARAYTANGEAGTKEKGVEVEV